MAPFLARMSAAAGGAFRFCVVPSTAVSDCNVMTAVRSLDLATARSCDTAVGRRERSPRGMMRPRCTDRDRYYKLPGYQYKGSRVGVYTRPRPRVSATRPRVHPSVLQPQTMKLSYARASTI